MLIVHVAVRVLPDQVASFRTATLANAGASMAEPGVPRFDVLSDQSDSARFTLVEVYRDEEAARAHKETEHYATWRDAVAPMMAEPRASTRYTPVFPADPVQWRAGAA